MGNRLNSPDLDQGEYESSSDLRKAEEATLLARTYGNNPGLKTDIDRITSSDITPEERFRLAGDFYQKYSSEAKGLYSSADLSTDDCHIQLRVFSNGSLDLRIKRK